MVLPLQTSTPYLLTTLPDKAPLQEAMVGLKLNQLRTPALIIDRARFAEVSSTLPLLSSLLTSGVSLLDML